MLHSNRFIPLTTRAPTLFDHGAFDAATQRVFAAHTAANTLEVIDAVAGRHLRTLPGFPEAAGVVAASGQVVVTNRGAASLSVLDADTLATLGTFATGVRPNAVALALRRHRAVVACVGTDDDPPLLQRLDLASGDIATLPLPGRPRWCMVDAAEERVFCAIRAPSMVFVAGLTGFTEQARWPLPSAGAHGIDSDPERGILYVACDGGNLVAVESQTGMVVRQWPLPGVPDATFCNPATQRVHVAVGVPGCILTVDTRTGATTTTATEEGAKTTALAAPDRLFVFLPTRGGALELREDPV